MSFGGGFSQGGGGFMADGGGGDGGAMRSPASRNLREQRNIIPATIKQLQSAMEAANPDTTNKESPFQIDGRDCHHFKIVAVIAEASENTTHVQLKLEDGTGQCSIKVWQTGDDLAWAQTKEKLKEGVYVAVVGTVKALGSNLALVSHHIAPVANTNEVTHHQLSAIYAHLLATKGPLITPGATSGTAGAGPAAFNPTAAPSFTAGSAAVQPAAAGAGQEQQVLLAFQALGASSDEGASVSAVAEHLQANGTSMTEQALRTVVDSLAMQGLLYSTIDENHFATTM